MMPESESAPQRMTVRRATFYFALVYFSQGACQLPTLLNQPVRMYLEKVGHFDSQAISRFYFVALIPWVIKPLYGMLSDFVPLFRYRRKSYLLLLNVVAAVSFLLVAGIHSVQALDHGHDHERWRGSIGCGGGCNDGAGGTGDGTHAIVSGRAVV